MISIVDIVVLLKRKVKAIIRRFVLKVINEREYIIEPVDFRLSYSQDGEDIVIDELFNSIEEGFYVDIGAHHPTRFSNTYRLYKAGWMGICIDPIPLLKERFFNVRPRDIFVDVGIDVIDSEIEYYQFEEKALNTFDFERVKDLEKKGIPLLTSCKVAVRPLRSIFSEYNCKKIDFLSIDVESYEIHVLNSNDWNKFRPLWIAIEIHDIDLEHLTDNSIYNFLYKKNYSLKMKTFRTCFFKSIC